jgi:hypothetical protein
MVDGQADQPGPHRRRRDEEDQPGPVAVFGGIVVGLRTHRPAEELDDGVQRARHADAVDRTGHRPVGAFQDTLDADHDVERRGGMGAVFSASRAERNRCLSRAGRHFAFRRNRVQSRLKKSAAYLHRFA